MTFPLFTGRAGFKVSKWIAAFHLFDKKKEKGKHVCWKCVCVPLCVGGRGRRGRNMSAFVDITWFPGPHHTAKCVWPGERNREFISELCYTCGYNQTAELDDFLSGRQNSYFKTFSLYCSKLKKYSHLFDFFTFFQITIPNFEVFHLNFVVEFSSQSHIIVICIEKIDDFNKFTSEKCGVYM